MNPRPDHGEQSYRGSGKLRGKRALITGGDSGIGRAAAIALAREGADVAIAYLPAEEADARDVVQIFRQGGRRFAALPGDLRDKEYTTGLPDGATSQLGGLDILVNNAAYQQWVSGLEQLSDEQFDQTMKTNLYAMFWLTKAALRRCVSRRIGRRTDRGVQINHGGCDHRVAVDECLAAAD